MLVNRAGTDRTYLKAVADRIGLNIDFIYTFHNDCIEVLIYWELPLLEQYAGEIFRSDFSIRAQILSFKCLEVF